jgi:hypothetical protein
MKTALRVILLIVVGAVLLVGCGGAKPDAPTQDIQAPDWVIQGGGAGADPSSKVFYGVGSASGIKNMSLLRTTADNRARADLAKVFQFYSASLMKDYMASTLADDPNVTSEEQHVEQAVKTVTSITLSGVLIVDHWQNPSTMEMFSRAKIDLDAFKGNLEKAKELDQRVKEYIKQNADRLHDDLERQTEKLEQ